MRARKRGMMEKRLAKWYPPGYEWREELISAAILLGLAFFLSWRYLFRLGQTVQGLYIFYRGERVLRPDAVAKSFTELVQGSFLGFYLPFVFLAVMIVWHYVCYWRHTKSIYVMRRLPKRGVVFRSCVKGPVLCAVMLALMAVVLWGLYLGLYWLAIPAECMPRLV